MPNKTGITESQIAQFVLQALVFVIPFTAVEMSQAQMQAASGIAATLAVFAFNQRRKQKEQEK